MQIIIPGEPTTKKNSQRILINKRTGRPFVKASAKYEAYEKHCALYMPRLKEPINKPVNIKCLFFRGTRRRVDLINLLECIADILVAYKVIADDNRNVMYAVDGSRVFYNKDNPRVEITIDPIVTEDFESWETNSQE